MRNWSIATLLLVSAANAHTIFQKVSVNGADEGYFTGVRTPQSENPITNVNSAGIICNVGIHQPVSPVVINIPPGAKVGAFWINGFGPSHIHDPDNPVDPSHKGPILVYLAKVPNAATTGTTGLKWFKVASDGLTGTTWGVDHMIANGGWSYFTMPTCIAPGNYLMRIELIALHNAYSRGGAQFYMSCAQINVTGSGTFTPNSTVSFPGAYKATDPGILIDIYDDNGQPTNAGKKYLPPGPPVITCPGGGHGG